MKKDINSKNPMNELLEISREQKNEEVVAPAIQETPAKQNMQKITQRRSPAFLKT